MPINEEDRQTWQALYEQCADDILRYLVKLTGQRHDAEELLQEAFARAMDSGLTGVRSPRAWLFRIATNAARDRARSKARRPTAELSDAEPDQRPVFDVEVDLLHRALSDIPFDDATALLLRFDAGLTAAEIAALDGLSEEAVKSRLRRAKERFMSAYFSQQRVGR